ncbi:MAG: SRPBCC domain-containing protein [Actinomycetota bacterium]|nr:SRPBCC domain-containing protein [Actinomycetota bacterium]
MTDQNSPAQAVRIELLLNVPVEIVWQMWTQPEHFQAWYGPSGATVVVAKMELVVGGARLVSMEVMTPNGPMKMWFTGEHLEIVENQRLVYTEAMCDESGNVISPADMGMPADHPSVTTITVELEGLESGTKMVLVHAGIPEGSPGEAGWIMAFDKLVAYVEERTQM